MAQGWHSDGSVVDASGVLWNAQYCGSSVAAYGPDEELRDSIAIPARNTTCPAFVGSNLDRIYCTSATQNLDPLTLAEHPLNGQTFVIDGIGPGQDEHRVIL